MNSSELHAYICGVLRITTSDRLINLEVSELIESAKADLRLSGIFFETDVYDFPIVRAIALYCKANFGFDNPEAERLMESYRSLETHLALAEEYGGQADEI